MNQVFRESKLESIFIPKSIVSYAGSFLEGVSTMKNIDVDPENTVFCSIDGVLYSKDETIIYAYPSNKSQSFNVPETVKIIEILAFDSAQITSVSFPSSLQTIGSYCFKNSKLTSVIIPDSVTALSPFAFSSCTSLTYAKLPNQITILNTETFYACDLRSIEIPSKVSIIYSRCFALNQNLGKVILPISLRTLHGGVFSGCPKVELQFPDNATIYLDEQYLILNKQNTTVSQYLGSEERATIKILPTVETISNSAFSGKTNIISIVFEDSSALRTIGNEAFYGCTALSSFSFPSTLQEIGERAFYHTALTQISFGSSLKTVKLSAFSNCDSLNSISFQNTKVTILTERLFNLCTDLETVSLPPNLQEIEKYCFYRCSSLKSISFPSSIRTFNDNVFLESGIENVSFLSDCLIENLSSYSFYGATKLSNFTFPQKLKTIESFALANCGLTNIILPTSVQTLSMNCFSSNSKLITFTIPEHSQLSTVEKCVFEKCINLEKIESFITAFPVDNGALINSERTKILAYPPQSPTKYFYVLQSVTTIEESAFSNCVNLVHVLIPENSVKIINLRAFQNCTKLTMINIPSNVTEVGNDVFTGCKSLKCGISADVSDEVMNMLLTKSGLKKNQLMPCSVANTCNNNFLKNRNLYLSILTFTLIML